MWTTSGESGDYALVAIFELPDYAFYDCADWDRTFALSAPAAEGAGAKGRRKERVPLCDILSVSRASFRGAVMGKVFPPGNQLGADSTGEEVEMGGPRGDVRRLFHEKALWFVREEDGEDGGGKERVFVTKAPLAPTATTTSSPEAADHPHPSFDFAIVEEGDDTPRLIFVAAEPDTLFAPVQAVLLWRCVQVSIEQAGATPLHVSGAVWLPQHEAHTPCSAADGAEDAHVAALAKVAGCATQEVTQGSSTDLPPYGTWLEEAVRESGELANCILQEARAASTAEAATPATLSHYQRLILPWVLALRRVRRQRQQQDGSLPILPFAPPTTTITTATPLPAKNAPLFGLIVFPKAVRDGYTHVHGAGAVLPEAVLAFLNAKGAPVFKYDDEALDVLGKLVLPLRAAVAVYDEWQREELVRLLDAWARRTSSGDKATSLAASVFSVERCLSHLHEAEVLLLQSSNDPSTMPAVEKDGGGPVERFLRACAEEKAWRFDVRRVLSRNGAFSLQPVPPISQVTVKSAGTVKVNGGAAADGTSTKTKEGEGEEEVRIAFEPSAFPPSFLAVALAQIDAGGVDKCEELAYNVFQTMKRLVTRQ